MTREVTGRQNSDSQGGERNLRGWTEAGHFTAHTSHNRNQELSGGVWGVYRSTAGKEGEPQEAPGSPGNEIFSLCAYVACQTNNNDLKHFFGGEDDIRCL